jgi:SOS-response transcriptional repressor LexA
MSIEINRRVEFFMKRAGLTQKQLSALSGVSQGMISSIITGNKKPGFDTQQALIKALGVTHEDFFSSKIEGENGVGKDVIPVTYEPHDRPVPIISWVQAGELAEAIDCWPEGVSGEGQPVLTRRKVSWKTFALKVVGDSMETRFKEGDIIVVDPEIEVQTGDYCIARVAGEVTFKIYYENGTEVRLKAMNPKYPDMVFPKDGAVDFRVVGKVVELIAKI